MCEDRGEPASLPSLISAPSLFISPLICVIRLLHLLRSQSSMFLGCAIDGEMLLEEQRYGRLCTISSSALQLRNLLRG